MNYITIIFKQSLDNLNISFSLNEIIFKNIFEKNALKKMFHR